MPCHYTAFPGYSAQKNILIKSTKNYHINVHEFLFYNMVASFYYQCEDTSRISEMFLFEHDQITQMHIHC